MAAAGPPGLRILGGDANIFAGPWKQIITGPFGYGDACGGNPDCPAQNWTVPVIIAGSTSCSRAASPRTRPQSSPT